MSSQASFVSVPSATAGDVVTDLYTMQVSGGRYEATPETVLDEGVKAFLIDANGRMVIIGPSADANTFINRPVGAGGVYRTTLPTYNDGEATVMHFSDRGRLLIQDDAAIAALAGVATEAKQDTQITALASLLTELQLKADLLETQPVSAASLPLPAGAATEAKQDALITELQLKADLSETQPVSLASIPINAASATAALQTTGNTSLSSIDGKLPATVGQKAMAASFPVVIASDQTVIPASQSGTWSVLPAGMAKSNAPYTIASYSAANVTTAAYTELVASTTAATKRIQIFDSSGQAMIIAVGAAASEVIQVYVPPGGGDFDLAIPASSRVSIKALTATASSGYFLINFLG